MISFKLGSGSSGISCGRTPNSAPGPIDNSGLVAPTTYKNVQTLTGEGGRLKRDLILSQHKDYELVPESLWKALSQWYKGPLPLPRQVCFIIILSITSITKILFVCRSFNQQNHQT